MASGRKRSAHAKSWRSAPPGTPRNAVTGSCGNLFSRKPRCQGVSPDDAPGSCNCRQWVAQRDIDVGTITLPGETLSWLLNKARRSEENTKAPLLARAGARLPHHPLPRLLLQSAKASGCWQVSEKSNGHRQSSPIPESNPKTGAAPSTRRPGGDAPFLQ